jgi:LmbE family N-acetylglucosaminyl deacetylase
VTRPAGPGSLDRLARVVTARQPDPSGQPGQAGGESEPVGPSGTLLTVWAHPDDETYLAGGLMAAASAAGWRVVCVTATVGELAGEARLRSAELARALALLGVREHLLLDYPDGGCASADADRAAARIAEVVAAVRPDVVVTFGPDGMTGHPDHQAVSGWVDRAVDRAAVDRAAVDRAAVDRVLDRGPAQPPCLLHASCGATQAASYADLDTRLDVMMPGATRPCRPDDEIALTVRLAGAALDRKVAALRAHRSQTAGLIAELGAEQYAGWVAVEEFVLAPAGVPVAVPVAVPVGSPTAVPSPTVAAAAPADE